MQVLRSPDGEWAVRFDSFSEALGWLGEAISSLGRAAEDALGEADADYYCTCSFGPAVAVRFLREGTDEIPTEDNLEEVLQPVRVRWRDPDLAKLLDSPAGEHTTITDGAIVGCFPDHLLLTSTQTRCGEAVGSVVRVPLAQVITARLLEEGRDLDLPAAVTVESGR